MAAGLDEWAADNLLGYLREQREATGHVPDDRTIVVERFRDEIGDWRVAILSPFGAQVHAPWAPGRQRADARPVRRRRAGDARRRRHRAAPARPRARRGRRRARAAESGRELLDLVTLDPDDVRGLVTEEIGGSALFAARFRECAARALLLPRRRPDRRQPLWQQRQRASQLLEVASQYPTFPIVLEAVRECVQDVFDVPGLVDLMRDIGSRRVTVVDVESSTPVAVRQVAALRLRRAVPLRGRLARSPSGGPRRWRSTPACSPSCSAPVRGWPCATCSTPSRSPAPRPSCSGSPRSGPPATPTTCSTCCAPSGRCPSTASSPAAARARRGDDVEAWLAGLDGARQVIAVRVAGEDRWAAIEDASTTARRPRGLPAAGRPAGLPRARARPARRPGGPLRPHPRAVPRRRGGPGLRARPGRGARPPWPGSCRRAGSSRASCCPPVAAGTEFCDAEVLRMLRRRSLAALRAEVEPVTPVELARFLQDWQGVGGRLRGREGLVRVVEQLSGAVLPASALESLVLPARVADYTPGPARRADGHRRGALVRPRLAAGRRRLGLAAPRRLGAPHPARARPRPGAVAEGLAVLDALAGGGAHFFRTLVRPGRLDRRRGARRRRSGTSPGRAGSPATPSPRCGRCCPVAAPPTAAPPTGPRRTRYAGRRGPLGGLGSAPARPSLPARTGPPQVTGRWSLLPPVDLDPTLRAYATAELLLDRHGILTRGATAAEDVPGGFAAVYRVLGRPRRPAGCAAATSSRGSGPRSSAPRVPSTGCAARVRATPADRRQPSAVVLAASDPANPYGAALGLARPRRRPGCRRGQHGADDGSTDKRRRHQPGRKAGAVVVLVDGELVLYVERGGRTLLTYADDPDRAAGRPPPRSPMPCAAAAWAASPWRRPTAAGCWARTTPWSSALEEAGFHLTPRGLRIRR